MWSLQESITQYNRIVNKNHPVPFQEKLSRFSESVRLLEHGVKGQKWGIHKHHQSSGGSDKYKSAEDKSESSKRAIDLKDRTVRTPADSLALVKQAEKQVDLHKLMYDPEYQAGKKGGSSDKQYDKLDKEYDKLTDHTQYKLESKLEDLYDSRVGTKGDKRDAIDEKIADTKSELKDVDARIKWLEKEYDKRDDGEEWNPSKYYRHAMFEAAGFDAKSYGEFHEQLHDWVDDGGGKNHPLRVAAKQVYDGNAKSMNAKGLLIENAINRSFYGDTGTLKLWRGIDTKQMEKIVEKAIKADKDTVTVLFNHSDHWSTDKETSKDFGSVVFRNMFPKKDILLSYRTNHVFDDYEGEKEVVPLVRGAKITFALKGSADKGARARHFPSDED